MVVCNAPWMHLAPIRFQRVPRAHSLTKQDQGTPLSAGRVFGFFKRYVLVLLVVAFGVAAGFSLLGRREQLFSAISDIEPLWLLFALASFTIASLLRVLRFRVVIPDAVTFAQTLHITSVYQFSRAVTPAQLGEFSYPIMVKRLTGRSLGAGLGQLIIVRFADLVGLVAFFSIGLLGRMEILRENPVYLGAAIAILAALAMFATGTKAALLGIRLAALRLRKVKRLARSARRVGRTARHALQAYLTTSRPQILAITSLTFFVSLFAVGRVFGLLTSAGITLSPLDVFFVFGAVNLLAVVPLRLTAGLGIKEAGLLSVLLAIGVDPASAVLGTVMFALAAVAFPAAFLLVSAIAARSASAALSRKSGT